MTPTKRPSMIVGVVSDRRRLARAVGCAERDPAPLLVEQAAAAAAAGADFYQIREPDLDAGPLLALVRQVVEATRGRLALFVNDRADVAVAAGTGVHLRASSIAAARLRGWLPASTRLMRAVHDVAQVRLAGPVSALLAGTAAATPSKSPGHATLGPDGLRALVAVSEVPVIAIGGLDVSDWSWVSAAGARGWAGIGAFLPTAGESIAAAIDRVMSASRDVAGGVPWSDEAPIRTPGQSEPTDRGR